MGGMLSHVVRYVVAMKWDAWAIIGFAAQAMFFMRFFVQWLASEKAKQSIVPVSFWYFSVGGGVILLIYAIHRADPVFVLGQFGGLLIYLRNLHLIHKGKLATTS